MDGDLTERLLRKSSDESSGKRRESPPPLAPSSRDTKNPTDSSDSSTSGASTNLAPARDECKNLQEVVVSSAASEDEQGAVSTGEEEDKEAEAAPLARWEAVAASAARLEAAAAASAARREAGRGFFSGGGSTLEAGGGSSGRAEHLILIPPPGAAGLIRRAQHFDSWSCMTDPILAGPSADLTVALQAFAAAPDATTAARLEQAAAALDSVASSNTEDGAVAKQLAIEATALAAGWRGDDLTGQGSSAFETAADQREPELPAPAACHSTEFLLCAVISGSVALLPYLPTQVPKKSRRIFAVLFGIAFFIVSISAMLLVAPVHKRAANIMAGVSFATFTVLVMAFVGFALGGGTYS